MHGAPPIQVRLQNALTAARKSRDAAATLLLGTILADVKNRALEVARDLTDGDVVEVVRRGIKKRREALELYEKAGRVELAAKERREVALLEDYLPAQAGADEIRAAVKAAIAAGATNVGAVMGKVMPQFKGTADGTVVSGIVREELGGRPA